MKKMMIPYLLLVFAIPAALLLPACAASNSGTVDPSPAVVFSAANRPVSGEKYMTGADPVTGRNEQIDLRWEQLCLATGYELQIAKDRDFTLRINPAVNSAGTIAAVTGSILLDMDETNMTNPAAWIAPGALPEAGAIYYWRIRVYRSATGQLAYSPWSEARSFTVKAGFIVNTPY